MPSPAALIVAAFVLGGLSFVAGVIVPAWFRYRGKRLVTCPETKTTAAVEVDAVHAAVTAGIAQPVLQLSACNRWPERKGCGQECLGQIAAAPADCLVRNIAARWYEGRQCVYCAKPFGEIHWHDRQPALMAPDRKTVQWNEIQPETLKDVLATHRPVCWDCYIVESFRSQHPELAVERPWPR